MGVEKDDGDAVWYFREAAIQGHADAQFRLGLMYEEGNGIPQDFQSAHVWFNIAAGNDSKKAAKARRRVEKHFNEVQIHEAQHLARRCVKSEYKDCP